MHLEALSKTMLVLNKYRLNLSPGAAYSLNGTALYSKSAEELKYKVRSSRCRPYYLSPLVSTVLLLHILTLGGNSVNPKSSAPLFQLVPTSRLTISYTDFLLFPNILLINLAIDLEPLGRLFSFTLKLAVMLLSTLVNIATTS